MKALFLIVGLILIAATSQADTVCQIEGTNHWIGIGKDLLRTPTIYVEESDSKDSKILESYQITSRENKYAFLATNKTYDVKIDFKNKFAMLHVANEKAKVGEALQFTDRNFELKNCKLEKK